MVGGKQKATESHQWAQGVQEAIPELIPKLSRSQDRHRIKDEGPDTVGPKITD